MRGGGGGWGKVRGGGRGWEESERRWWGVGGEE